MPTLYDVIGPLDWCDTCGRLLTFSHLEDTCDREYCGPREAAQEEEDDAQRALHSAEHNKGGEGGWH